MSFVCVLCDFALWYNTLCLMLDILLIVFRNNNQCTRLSRSQTFDCTPISIPCYIYGIQQTFSSRVTYNSAQIFHICFTNKLNLNKR